MLEETEMQKIFAGLRELNEAAFPKRCVCCAREYASAAEFIAATQAPLSSSSGLKPGEDDDGNPIIELFRNCACGSTLMESFNNRRDLTDAGGRRRRRFEDKSGD